MLCMQILYMMNISFGILYQLYRCHTSVMDKVLCTAISIPWIYPWSILVYTIDICLTPFNMEVTQSRIILHLSSANEGRCWHLTDSKQAAMNGVLLGQNLPSFCSWFSLSSSMWSCYDVTQICVVLLWFHSDLCGPAMISLGYVQSYYDFTELCVVLL